MTSKTRQDFRRRSKRRRSYSVLSSMFPSTFSHMALPHTSGVSLFIPRVHWLARSIAIVVPQRYFTVCVVYYSLYSRTVVVLAMSSKEATAKRKIITIEMKKEIIQKHKRNKCSQLSFTI